MFPHRRVQSSLLRGFNVAAYRYIHPDQYIDSMIQDVKVKTSIHVGAMVTTRLYFEIPTSVSRMIVFYLNV